MAQGDRPGKKPFDPAKAEQMKSDFIRGAKFAPMDLLGAPVDLTTMAMRGVGIPVPEKPFLGSEYLIDKYADLGEALDINYDRPTGSGMETLGRVMAGTAGLGGEAAVALAPGIGRLFTQTTKTRGSGIEAKGSGNIEMGASSTPGKYDEFFENMGEEGAGMEFPAVGQAVDSYVMEFDPKKSFDLLDGALKSEDYPGYARILRANLDRQFPGEKISVSRTENYSDPRAGIEGRRSKTFFEVDKDDVLFAGSDSERELIIRGPKGTYNEGGPMSVRIEEAPPSDLEPLPSEKFGDFTTPELITAWTIDQTKVPRAEVAARLKNDPSATARTNEALDDLGYGDTVPVYRYIMLKGDKESAEFVPEGLISATLDPRQLKSNIFFMDKTNPVFTDTVQRLVRYDVPRDRIAGYLPAFSDQIKRGVNKAVKERGIGQKKITGTKVVTNPAEHSKTLLKLQDEVIADVSDLEPKFFSTPSYSSRGVVPRDVRENEVGSLILPMVSKGKIDTSGFSETRTALNRLDFGGYGAADDQL